LKKKVLAEKMKHLVIVVRDEVATLAAKVFSINKWERERECVCEREREREREGERESGG
jgi:hypothetical protein